MIPFSVRSRQHPSPSAGGIRPRDAGPSHRPPHLLSSWSPAGPIRARRAKTRPTASNGGPRVIIPGGPESLTASRGLKPTLSERAEVS